MQILLALIPFLTFLILWAILYKRQGDWRSAFLAAAVLCAVYLVLMTEVLSLFRAITLISIVAVWLMALVLALGWAFRTIRNLPSMVREIRQSLVRAQPSPLEWILMAACVFIALATALVAWMAPPNTWDSLTYHMPRVMHWFQDRSVAFYPTNNIRQLYLGPGAEFIILHLQILAGSDRLANFVQWFSMIGSAMGVSLIARQLGSGRRAQLYAAVAGMTIPMGVMQATSTQTDYVTAFWLVCFAFWMLELRNEWSWWISGAVGASLGLAVLTKATAYAFALPFALWLALWLLRRFGAEAIKVGTIILAAFLLLNIGSYSRNISMYRSPLGPANGTTNTLFSPAALASNVVRNLSLHMGTPFPRVNSFLQDQIGALHNMMGISVNDPHTTWGGTPFEVAGIRLNEDIDGNPLHLLLVALSMVLVVWHSKRGEKVLLLYTVSLLLGFLVFCLILKWQLFNSRLQLPWFVLFAPVIAESMEQLTSEQISRTAMLVLILAALPWLALNSQRPLLGPGSIVTTDRNVLYFQYDRPRFGRYSRATQLVAERVNNGCGQVGIDIGSDDWEYPIWVLLRQKTFRPVTIEHVMVQNNSRLLMDRQMAFSPCAIFVRNPSVHGTLLLNNRLYVEELNQEWLSVYVAK